MNQKPPPHEVIAKTPAPRAEGVGRRIAATAEGLMTMTGGQTTATGIEIPSVTINNRRAAAAIRNDRIARRILLVTVITTVQRQRADLVIIQTVRIPMIPRAIRPGIARPTRSPKRRRANHKRIVPVREIIRRRTAIVITRRRPKKASAADPVPAAGNNFLAKNLTLGLLIFFFKLVLFAHVRLKVLYSIVSHGCSRPDGSYGRFNLLMATIRLITDDRFL